MKTLILQRLKDIESRYDVKILLAVESGSRAWGFASKDSDYDVRFIYVHRKEWYLTLIEGRDVIEELDPDGVMDLAGWDIKKALLLMGKGNCAFAEWLNSPIVYYKDDKFLESMNSLKDEYFRKVSAVNHYYHMAMNHDKRYLEKRGCEMKKFMYHIRGLLAAKYAAIYGTYPPVLFNDLVEKMICDKNIKEEIAELVVGFVTSVLKFSFSTIDIHNLHHFSQSLARHPHCIPCTPLSLESLQIRILGIVIPFDALLTRTRCCSYIYFFFFFFLLCFGYQSVTYRILIVYHIGYL